MIFLQGKELTYDLYLSLTYDEMKELKNTELNHYNSVAAENEKYLNELTGFRKLSFRYGVKHDENTKEEFLKDFKIYTDRVTAFETMNNILNSMLEYKDTRYLDDFGFDYDEKTFDNHIKSYCISEKELYKTKESLTDSEDDIYISLP